MVRPREVVGNVVGGVGGVDNRAHLQAGVAGEAHICLGLGEVVADGQTMLVGEIEVEAGEDLVAPRLAGELAEGALSRGRVVAVGRFQDAQETIQVGLRHGEGLARGTIGRPARGSVVAREVAVDEKEDLVLDDGAADAERRLLAFAGLVNPLLDNYIPR